ncbi:MAG: SDR family NAD(P)-dependent oxidoreductase [Cellvibrionaceae bacterium]
MGDLGRNSTALDIIEGIDLKGKIAIVTGGSSGIGTETARALAVAGAELILPTRDLEYGSAIADKLITESGNSKIRNYEMDLSDFDSVRRFADNFMTEYRQLDILVNNAGIMACPPGRCRQGYELHFSVNHLGHFLLTACLSPCLLASAASRVVTLSSVCHRLSPVVFDDLHFNHRSYDKWLAYGQSKTATALFALALNERLQGYGGSAFAVHPGSIMTNLQRHMNRQEMVALGWIDKKNNIHRSFKSAAQGAATTVWAATTSHLADRGGAYCEDCQVAEPAREGSTRRGVSPYARDLQTATYLWDVSERLVDQPFCLNDVSRYCAAKGKMAALPVV